MNFMLYICLFISVIVNIWAFLLHGYGFSSVQSVLRALKIWSPLGPHSGLESSTTKNYETTESSYYTSPLVHNPVIKTGAGPSELVRVRMRGPQKPATDQKAARGTPYNGAGSLHNNVSDSTIRTNPNSVSWSRFVNLPLSDTQRVNVNKSNSIPYRTLRSPLSSQYEPVLCSKEVVESLASPKLSQENFEWCRWALSSTGGKVVVGKSWGNLKTKADQIKFDKLNCNAVQNGRNPSCDDLWGDVHIKNWRSGTVKTFQCKDNKPSKVNCIRNDNADVFCALENVQINFQASRKEIRGKGRTNSKQFRNDFINTDCSGPGSEAPAGFPFSHLYTPHITNPHCDYMHNSTVLMFSHDDIRNLGHTLNDIFNVWVMMWLDGLAGSSQSLDMLNIDSFKLGHNFDDQPNAFFLPYQKNLRRIFKGVDFADKTLCLKRVLLQPLPPRFFIWESWFVDMPCSFVGPSSLYQRWNLHVRHSYGLLQATSTKLTSSKLRVLLVVRQETKNLWGNNRSSRNFLNTEAITAALEEELKVLSGELGVPCEFIVQDLGQLDLMEQIKLIESSSIMVGAHGAGLVSLGIDTLSCYVVLMLPCL